jgi:hypothetical protein
VTPFDREDIHELAGALDDVVDLIDGCGPPSSAIFHIKVARPHGMQLSEVLMRAGKTIEEVVGKNEGPEGGERG